MLFPLSFYVPNLFKAAPEFGEAIGSKVGLEMPEHRDRRTLREPPLEEQL
jgi:hypothetical protein